MCASLTFLRHICRYSTSLAGSLACSATEITVMYSLVSPALMKASMAATIPSGVICALPSIVHTSGSSTLSANSVARSIEAM